MHRLNGLTSAGDVLKCHARFIYLRSSAEQSRTLAVRMNLREQHGTFSCADVGGEVS